MDSCVFCKIIQKKIPAQIVYEDNEFIVIHDIQKQAKVHALVIPKLHLATLADAIDNDALNQISQKWFHVALQVAKSLGVESSGYRLVLNQRDHGGQTVHHLHMHLLGGEQLNSRFS